MRDYYVITDGKGNYLTRKGLGADMSLSDNHNFAYTYDTEKDAESVIKAAQKMPAFKNVELKVISRKEIKESKVMKHVKTFESFVNEAHLPFSIEKELQLGGAEFMFDEERTEEDDDKRLDTVEVYVWEDRRSGAYWVGKVGVGGGFYYLELQKDGDILFSEKYPKGQKQYFDQDCVNSLGFSPEL